ncbi:MAG: xanthine dehydrogenase family protein molybdopterin-binding subunit [Acidobacteria bacterium]|nr:xanthine dehydrogenase family protein molybdopterin-binding subunit [Acidobacteriota bacterium]
MKTQEDLMHRREFIKLLGPGIYFLFSIDECLFGQQPRGMARGYPEDFNAYLRIGVDGKVTCFTGKVELGQGIIASLAQMLAEELEVPYESVSMVMGDTKLCPWDSGTNGSRSIKYFGPALRAAGAEAREVMIQMAAEHLKTPPGRLIARDGIVSDKSDPEVKVSYGFLAEGKTIERHLEKKPPLKSPEIFSVCGQSSPRADFEEKVTGKAKFAGDIRLPRMLYGKVLRPPAHGARLKAVDLSAAKKIKEAILLQDGDFVAVVHPLPDMAEKILAMVKADYEVPAIKVNEESIYEHILNAAAKDNVIEQKGDLELGRKLAAVRFEESYRTPYVAHAAIETHSAIADVGKDSATIWIGTQRPFGASGEIANAIGLAAEKIRIITPYVGGGYGGKSQIGQAVQAARLSKMTGVPIQVVWTREEEFFYDTFQPAAVVKIASGLDESNRISFWDYHVFFAGERSSQNIYSVPNLRTVSRGSAFGGPGPHPFGTGAWRGPGSNTNIFARESQMDIMASKAGMDPLEFRIRNLTDERMLRVVRAAAEKFSWKPAKTPSGRGCGMVCLDYLGTYVAAMAHITVDKDSGRIQVKRVVLAQDMGPVINPEGARMQIEGSIVMGLGYCLSEEIHFSGSEIKDLGFGSYQIPRFSWVPEIEAVLVKNFEIEPSGCGEPPIVGMGALLANALFDATGARIRQLPLTRQRIKEQLV